MFYYSLDPDGGPKDSDFWNFGLEDAAINDIGAVIKFMERVRVLDLYPNPKSLGLLLFKVKFIWFIVKK